MDADDQSGVLGPTEEVESPRAPNRFLLPSWNSDFT
jgi:hypothetical protein